MNQTNTLASLLAALNFAAAKHRDQRRKGEEGSPYINHPIEVAEMLIRVGGIDDIVVLMAAILHDTVEDTQTTAEELEEHFGAEVRGVVMEVTDDRSLPKAIRKQVQVEHAPHLSRGAQQVKLADKIANVRSVAETPPAHWPLERRLAYFDWADEVVAGLRGCNPPLEALYDKTVKSGRETLSALAPGSV